MMNKVNFSPNKFIAFNKALLKSMGIAFITGSVIVLVFSQPVKSYVGLFSILSILYGGILLIYMVAAYAIWGMGCTIARFSNRYNSEQDNTHLYKVLHIMLVIVIPVFLTAYTSFFLCLVISFPVFD